MKERSLNQKLIISTHKAFIIPAAGYLCIAITWWILGILIISWLSLDVIPDFILNILYLASGAFLFFITVLSWLARRKSFDQVIFLSMAALFFFLFFTHFLFAIKGMIIKGYSGWFALVWALFFCYIWILALKRKTDFLRTVFALTFWLGTLVAALSGWINGYLFGIIAGYILLVSAILALIVSITEVLRYFRERFLETGGEVSVTH